MLQSLKSEKIEKKFDVKIATNQKNNEFHWNKNKYFKKPRELPKIYISNLIKTKISKNVKNLA